MSVRLMVFSNTSTQKLYIYTYINRLASLWGRPNTLEKQPYITPKSNPSKEKKTLAGPIYKTQLTADSGQIWVLEIYQKPKSSVVWVGET